MTTGGARPTVGLLDDHSGSNALRRARTGSGCPVFARRQRSRATKGHGVATPATALAVAHHTADTLHMRSILQRGTERLRYEIYTGSGQTPYVLRIAAPGGGLVLDERFPEPYALHERAARVERLLIRQGWRGPLLDG